MRLSRHGDIHRKANVHKMRLTMSQQFSLVIGNPQKQQNVVRHHAVLCLTYPPLTAEIDYRVALRRDC